jgi:uroporphyrinogen decarboxylase
MSIAIDLPNLILDVARLSSGATSGDVLVAKAAWAVAQALPDARITIWLKAQSQTQAAHYVSGHERKGEARFVFSRPIALRGQSYGQLQIEFLESQGGAGSLMKTLETISLHLALAAERLRLEREQAVLKAALATEKMVARASGIVARERGLTLGKARQWLQSEASRTGRPLYWISDMLVAGRGLFSQPGDASASADGRQAGVRGVISRRAFFATAAAPLLLAKDAGLTSRQRVDRVLDGKDVDRPPLSLWHHFGLEKDGPKRHAQQTLAFHRDYGTDLVKVMSDFPYSKSAGSHWWELKEEKSPFSPQLEALRLIRDGLGGKAHFVETIFNPWNVAEKLSSKQDVQRLKQEQPQKLLDALEVIAKSEANHARLALQAGASGIFLAIANAEPPTLSREDYLKFSAPFDRIVLNAARDAKLNVLHIHGAKVQLDLFEKDWPAAVLNYSVKSTGVPLAKVREGGYKGVLAGGIDEVAYRGLTGAQLREQWQAAKKEAGARFILTPGCSVPNDASPEELKRLRGIFS